jgi:hypothetical protein
LELSRRLPSWAEALGEIPDVVAEHATAGASPLGRDPSACLAIGEDAQLGSCLMWKWQEGLYTRLPIATDVLSFAHGPFQSFYETEHVFLTLRRLGDFAHDDIWKRFERTRHSVRHQVKSLSARLPGPLAFFEFDIQLAHILLEEARARGIDPAIWPGQGEDGPLYALYDHLSGGQDAVTEFFGEEE